ncbi:hypothetical protein [Vreelandella sulfidaeris]
MTGKRDIPVDQIAKLAEDIRVIKDFAENHNFDGNLLKAQITPSPKNSKIKFDWPLISMVISIIAVFVILAFMKFYEPSQGASAYLFVVGLLFSTIAVMCTHLRFKDTTITIISAFGLFLILFIGAGIFTPKEAFDNIKDIK